VYQPAPRHPGDGLAACVLAVILLASVIGSCAKPMSVDRDLTLAMRVENRLEVDRELRPFGLTAAAYQGTVVLRGRVEDDVDRLRAEAIARDTPGTQRVVNSIGVVTSPYDAEGLFRDAWVATRVKARLVADPDLDASALSVEARRGVIVLSGRVPGEDERRSAERLARNTRGVTEVINRLQVSTRRPS
jgi:hyperosmotically inducible periplasmic protein